MQYNRELKKKLCEGICFNGLSTLKTANEYNVPIKTLEKWITAFNKNNHCFDPIIETVTILNLLMISTIQIMKIYLMRNLELLL